MKFQIFNFKCQISNKNWKLEIGNWLLVIPVLQEGQAVVTLLFFMVMAITITTAAVVVVIANSSSSSINEQGTTAYYVAESGVEEGILQLIRNPLYSGGTFPVGNGTATLTVANGTITATGSAYNSERTIQVQTVYNNNVLSITSWKEL